jgi:hypothetical protein
MSCGASEICSDEGMSISSETARITASMLDLELSLWTLELTKKNPIPRASHVHVCALVNPVTIYTVVSISFSCICFLNSSNTSFNFTAFSVSGIFDLG